MSGQTIPLPISVPVRVRSSSPPRGGRASVRSDPRPSRLPSVVSPEALPTYRLHRGDVRNAYPKWPTPATIISDGAYGVRGFHGDTTGPDGLPDWYRPHIEAWSRAAHPSTTLWFWNTEVGWANVHPLLVASGWEYVEVVTWDKGIAHIAGNVNGKTIRRFPVVTEICVLYQRKFAVATPGGEMSVQRWLRHEWQRAGLPLYLANEACGGGERGDAEVPHAGLDVVLATRRDG